MSRLYVYLFMGCLVLSIIFLILNQTFLKSKNPDLSQKLSVREEIVYSKDDVLKLLQNQNIPIDKAPQLNSIKYDFLSKYPSILNCRKQDSKRWSNNQTSFTKLNHAKPASAELLSKRFVRGKPIQTLK